VAEEREQHKTDVLITIKALRQGIAPAI